jgi:hypothetical protein
MARKKRGVFKDTWNWLLEMGIFQATLVLNLIAAIVLFVAGWVLRWYVRNF